jgi:hypothetical protein
VCCFNLLSMDELMQILSRQGGPSEGPPMGMPPLAPIHGNPVAAVLVITVIMTIIVTARVFTKTVLLKKAGWDDLWVVVGAVIDYSHA